MMVKASLPSEHLLIPLTAHGSQFIPANAKTVSPAEHFSLSLCEFKEIDCDGVHHSLP